MGARQQISLIYAGCSCVKRLYRYTIPSPLYSFSSILSPLRKSGDDCRGDCGCPEFRSPLPSVHETASVPGGKTPGTIRPSIQVLLNNPDLVEYEVKDLQAPKVAGRLLKFLIWLAYTRFGQLAMVRSLLRRSNLDMLSGVYLPEKPTLCPTPLLPLRLQATTSSLTSRP